MVLRPEGEPDCSLLIVVSGEVRLSHDGTEIDKLHPGQTFGEEPFRKMEPALSRHLPLWKPLWRGSK
ncbi:cyclic nucleotide-binding domain-containing protein [Synechococcus sp. A15-24]|uniref:cyclic nucleotide-binding domain-containing protein n=1 Tax=Synechococcus sp. A15-24 TaxID=1050635 RepID=UPI003369DCD6